MHEVSRQVERRALFARLNTAIRVRDARGKGHTPRRQRRLEALRLLKRRSFIERTVVLGEKAA